MGKNQYFLPFFPKTFSIMSRNSIWMFSIFRKKEDKILVKSEYFDVFVLIVYWAFFWFVQWQKYDQMSYKKAIKWKDYFFEKLENAFLFSPLLKSGLKNTIWSAQKSLVNRKQFLNSVYNQSDGVKFSMLLKKSVQMATFMLKQTDQKMGAAAAAVSQKKRPFRSYIQHTHMHSTGLECRMYTSICSIQQIAALFYSVICNKCLRLNNLCNIAMSICLFETVWVGECVFE